MPNLKQILLFTILLSFLWSENNHTNALIKEHSPYLQQHAHNPVNWYPWGKEALNKAKKENKLIFLSIGYSTCHWCHVMEEESFTDVEVAKILNDDFISIKVDREEYSQIDKKYQKLYMAAHNKRGGWPLSVFMSPKQEVFFIGAYIPKEEGYGSKGLLKLLPSFVKLKEKRDTFKDAIRKYKKKDRSQALKVTFTAKIIDRVVSEIGKEFDVLNGGFASRPKFPEASKLELLLDIYHLNGNKKAYSMAEKTLQRMAEGGIYDQIGGGFFRYATDYEWQIPHFEKMLYANAELIAIYVKIYEMTGDKLYKKVVDETIAQMEKNYMQEGVYLSASDADSDEEEGGYFIYEYLEVKSALKAKGWQLKEIEDALAYLGIEEDGNIDGDLSHIHIVGERVPEKLDEMKAYLKSVRHKRTFPFVDKKINTAWNAMMIKALFVAARVNDKCLGLAQKRLESLLEIVYKNEVLYHQILLYQTPEQKALLEDYAFLIDALLAGYERTYEMNYLMLAERFTKEALKKFYRSKRWYLSDDGVEAYADFDDRYYTSALSVMLESLLKMATLKEKVKYTIVVEETLSAMGQVLDVDPASASKLVHTFLRLKMGNVIVHANKKKLQIAQNKLDDVKYPFLLSSVQESDEYLACKTTMCFAHDKNITKLIEKINKAVK